MATITLTVLFFAFSLINIQECHGVILNMKGTVVAVFTAFDKNGVLSRDYIPRFARKTREHGIENIYLVGYGGEGPSMNLTDRMAMVKTWVDEGKPLGLKFLVNVGALPLIDALELVKFCAELKVDGIVALPVITYKGNLKEVMHDLQLISDAAPELKLLYQDLDSITNPKVSAAAVYVEASKKICNFVGIITTMDTALLLKSKQSLQDKTIIIIGHDRIAAAYTSGFNASVCTVGNLFPKEVKAMETAYRNCNYEELDTLQARINSLVEAINNLNNTYVENEDRAYIENQKEAFRLINGEDLGRRIPLVKPTPAETQEIATNLLRLNVELEGYPN